MNSHIKLLKFLRKYRMFAIIGPLFMFVEVAMDLMQPMIMQLIIDEGIANSDTAYVIKMGIMMLVVAVIGLIGGLGCSIYSTKAAVNYATDIRKDVFQKIEFFSGRNTDTYGTGKLITIATNDISALQQAMMMTLKIFVRGPLLFIGSVIIVFITARELFPILLVLIPLLLLANVYIMKRAGRLFAIVQKAVDQVNTKLQENLAGIRVIKAFGRQDFEKQGFSHVNNDLTEANMDANKLIMGLMPIMLFLVNIGIIAALWLGVLKIEQGTTEIGVILAFINYLNITLNALISSSHVLMTITRSFPSADRVQEILTTDIDIKEPPNSFKPDAIDGDIEFRNVCFSYSKNGELVLKDLSFNVKQGEKIGIIGPIGSGKSTLIKLIPRLYDVDSGEILISGRNVQEYDLQSLRASIGFVPQKAMLFSGSIHDNMSYGKEHATKEEIGYALKAANAAGFVQDFEDGYEHVLTQGGNNLSGGQRQRISIARALIRKPAILILDDSTSAVDALSEKSIQLALKHEYKDSTKIIISSKISSMMDADQIFVMEDGRIVGEGTHEQLVKQNNVYREIYRIQGGKEGLEHESTVI